MSGGKHHEEALTIPKEYTTPAACNASTTPIAVTSSIAPGPLMVSQDLKDVGYRGSEDWEEYAPEVLRQFFESQLPTV